MTLINVAGVNSDFLEKSVAAFRSEVERGLALCADYLVLHPGSWRGDTREAGLKRAAEGLRQAEGLRRAGPGGRRHASWQRKKRAYQYQHGPGSHRLSPVVAMQRRVETAL